MDHEDTVLTFPLQGRLSMVALESSLVKMERVLPFLRRHLKELADDPTKLHIDQAQASIMKMREALDYICYNIGKIES